MLARSNKGIWLNKSLPTGEVWWGFLIHAVIG